MLKKPHKLRIVVLGGLFCLVGGGVCARLYNLQLVQHDRFVQRARLQQTKKVVLQPERGDILDRRERPLAKSTGRMALYVDPKCLAEDAPNADVEALARQISYYTHAKPEAILAKLTGKATTAVAHQLEPDAAERVANIIEQYGITRRSYWVHRETKRLYPRHLASSVIGFCSTDEDGDNKGISGLEYLWDKTLNGRRIEGTAPRSAISQTLTGVREEDVLEARGNTMVLTLDSAIQEAAETALDEMAGKYSLDAAGAVVEDARTGAILAMASWPTFDNNNFRAFPDKARRNRILTDPLETGSVVKLFTAAILFDTNNITLDTLVDCEGGHAVIDRRRITDAPGHTLHVAPFREVIAFSSNVGTVKSAQVLKNDEWYRYLRSFGMGQTSGIDLPGEGVGILYPVEKWTRLSRTSLPMGYEVALTPLQICNGITGIVNGGELLKPYIVAEVRDSRNHVIRRNERQVLRRIVRPTTSHLMREIMEGVVSAGTGVKAAVPGFRVGGKTGTTRKSNVFDHKEYVASFCGVIPINDPQITIYVYADNPKGAMYGGDVAAPAFQAIARAAIIQLGLVPTEPIEVATTAGAKADPKPGPAPASRAEAPEDEEPVGGVPDFQGLTMAEVRDRLPAGVSDLRLLGSGRAADQSPAPGHDLGPDGKMIVYFKPDADAAEAPAARTQGKTARSEH